MPPLALVIPSCVSLPSELLTLLKPSYLMNRDCSGDYYEREESDTYKQLSVMLSTLEMLDY